MLGACENLLRSAEARVKVQLQDRGCFEFNTKVGSGDAGPARSVPAADAVAVIGP